jgi:hypothetical protein
MVVLIDSENVVVSMKKWENVGNGHVQSRANLAAAWNFKAVVLGGCVIIFTPGSYTINTW